MSDCYLSLVIPAYNEQYRLPSSLDSLRSYLEAQDYTYEVLVVDNGSTDGTPGVVRSAASSWPRLRFIHIDARGKGIASRTGAIEAKGERIMLCDADFSMPVAQIERFLLLQPEYDIAIATREALTSRRISEPAYRHVMGRVFNGMVRSLILPEFQDTQCGFKCFSRRAAHTIFPRLTIHGFGFDVEVLYLARKYGFRVSEVPIDWYFQADSRVDPVRDTLAMVGDILRVRLNDARGRYS